MLIDIHHHEKRALLIVQNITKRSIINLGSTKNIFIFRIKSIFLFSIVYMWLFDRFFDCDKYYAIIQTKYELILCGIFINTTTWIKEIYIYYCDYISTNIVYIDFRLHNVICI